MTTTPGSGYTDLAGLLLDERSGTWSTGTEAELPSNAGSNPGVNLASVSCASAGNCAAVGDYTDSAGNTQGLLLNEISRAPTVQTGSASTVTQASAWLSGTANPNGAVLTDCEFDYGTTTAYGSSVPCAETVASGELSGHGVCPDLQSRPWNHLPRPRGRHERRRDWHRSGRHVHYNTRAAPTAAPTAAAATATGLR